MAALYTLASAAALRRRGVVTGAPRRHGGASCGPPVLILTMNFNYRNEY
jgi:hypothetical protein